MAGDVNPATGLTNEQWVSELYRAILGRAAEGAGYDYWVNALNIGLQTQGSLYSYFLTTPEAVKALKARLTEAYRTTMGREPDAAGLAYHLSLIQAGTVGPELTHITEYLSQFPEAQAYDGGPITRPGRSITEYAPEGMEIDDISDGTVDAGGGTPTSGGTIPAPVFPNPGVVPGIADSMSDRNMSAQIGMILARYDLQELESFVMAGLKDNWSDAEIILRLYEHDAFKARFPGIDLRRQNGLAPFSPEEYIQYEQQAHSLMRAAALPSSFYDDRSDFTNFIGIGVSVAELSSRIEQGYVRAVSAPDEVRARFAQWFGAGGDQALASLFLDPTKAMHVLEQQLTTAEIGGFGDMFGLNVGQDRASTLADMGFNGRSSLQGFRNVQTQQSLFDESISEGDDMTADSEGVDAAFGLDSDASARLERRRASRVNTLGGGGGLLITERGIGGTADQ